MSKTWILDVLTDLKRFANSNELPILASQLDDALLVAMAELASQDPELALARDGRHGKEPKSVPRTVRASAKFS